MACKIFYKMLHARKTIDLSTKKERPWALLRAARDRFGSAAFEIATKKPM
jgi:hypothetical protein